MKSSQEGVAVDTAAPSRDRRAVSPWVRFAISRLGALLATFAVAVVATFMIVQLIPGDPAVVAAGPDASPSQIEQTRERLGLDQPFFAQFANYALSVLRGDLGDSFSLSSSVSDIVFTRLPFTAILAVLAIALALVVAIPLGMAVAALTRGGRRRWLDVTFGTLTGFTSSVPPYVMATILVLVFALQLGLLPPAYTRNDPLASIVLPVLALSLAPLCLIARIMRRETAVALEQDYMRTARGWRISTARLYLRYALPNLLTNTLTLSGLFLASMLAGAIFIESVFAWPGIGSAVVDAILQRDYPLVQGSVLVLSMLAALLIVIVDVLLGLVDPRTLGGSRVQRHS